jgi:outer membrane lipoprotein-sorting protein
MMPDPVSVSLFQRNVSRKSFLILLFILMSYASFSQTDARLTLRAVYNKLQKAKDYSVQANIKVDMPFIRMLPIDATIYFKQKDKFHVESKSIAIVPRQGFDQSSRMLADTNSFTAVAQGTEMLGTIKTSLISILPLSDTSDLILGKLWIDAQQSLILKSQLTTKSNGTITTEYSYGSQSAFGLPDKMIFSVDVKKFKIPKGVATDNHTTDEKKKKENEKKKGKIYINLSNYQVNKGIPDSKFKK